MMISRYTGDRLVRMGKNLGSAEAASRIYRGVQRGQIPCDTRILNENERLDIIAGQKYGDSSLWWIIAAASGIGWGLQVPPGILLKIPKNAGDAVRLTY